MKTNLWLTQLVLILGCLVGCSQSRPARIERSPAPEIRQGPRQDGRFLRRMIRHHQNSIHLSQQGLVRLKSPRLRQLAKDILQNEGQELVQLQTWRQTWFSRQPFQPEPDPPLLQPGIPYDHAWAGALLQEHARALEAIRQSFSEFDQVELKQFSQSLQARLQAERAQLEGWLRENELRARDPVSVRESESAA